mmetsp:Transcript_30811/g.43135  ORF Transcript_30811/g.43135 Transcript_30811/m.43135 type:complete len:169 (-) Transcript_30811:41-547(-)|eukprot:jgi/Bigna1/66964/fgenesh1_pg.2_\
MATSKEEAKGTITTVCSEAKALVDRFKLAPHPEGGFFVETFRSKSCTAIYFLITPGSVSHMHILDMDEIWHFYKGDPMTVIELDENEPSQYRCTVLGSDYSKGHKSQYVVKAGTWFGSMPNKGSEYSFVGCTVAPPFQFEAFKMATKDIYSKFPKAEGFLKANKLVAE